MKLKIGLATMQTAWNTILEQEGLNHDYVDLNDELNIDEYSVLIINNRINLTKQKNLNLYIRKGGAAIICSPIYAEMYQQKIKSANKKYCVPQPKSIFADLGLIDFFAKFSWIASDKIEQLDSQLKIQYKKVNDGYVLILPFDVNSLILNTESTRKKFPADRNELPSEIVAKVSKGKIRELVFRCLKFLHDKRELPLVQKWRFPLDWQNFFMFRVDTDFCSAQQAKALYEVCNKNKIRGTWFADTVSQETLEQVYAKMPDQEIALHCRRHLVFPDYETNKENIENGLNDLKKADISVTGFAAPFGDWNKPLARVLAEKGFLYSSEFTLGYDDLPFYPIVNKRISPVLQIPIHPMSTGRMHRSHFAESEMWDYYKSHINDCLKNNHPILLYHHPSHGYLNVFDRIFKYINQKKINSLTYQEYARWWQTRTNCEIDVTSIGSKLTTKSINLPEDVYVRICRKDKFAFAKPEIIIDLEKLDWQKFSFPKPKKHLERTRKWHWRDALYNYESRKGKRNK
jgi:hypothetical protein